MRKFYWTVTFRDGTETWRIVWIGPYSHRILAGQPYHGLCGSRQPLTARRQLAIQRSVVGEAVLGWVFLRALRFSRYYVYNSTSALHPYFFCLYRQRCVTFPTGSVVKQNISSSQLIDHKASSVFVLLLLFLRPIQLRSIHSLVISIPSIRYQYLRVKQQLILLIYSRYITHPSIFAHSPYIL